MKKLLLVILFAAVLVCGLSGCSGKQEAPVADIADIIKKVEAVIGFDTYYMTKANEELVFKYIEINKSSLTDYVIKLSIGVTQNEYGVLIAEKGHEKEVENAVLAYLKFRKEAWDSTYLQEEGFKIENAKCERQGRYVFYAIGCENFDEVVAIFKELRKG